MPGQTENKIARPKEILAAAMLARALTGFQALILMAGRGFASEVRATCRSILEAKFRLGYVALEPHAGIRMLARHQRERVNRLKAYKSGELPVHKDSSHLDFDTLISGAEARHTELKKSAGDLPTIRKMAEMGEFLKDYAGVYTYLSDATHSGIRELETYLDFAKDETAVTNFRYGPNDGPWIPWCTLLAAGYLLDCIEIAAVIFDLRKKPWFKSWSAAHFRRRGEILDLYQGQMSGDFKAGKT
jgi:Family of unknown function (DUF5677)